MKTLYFYFNLLLINTLLLSCSGATKTNQQVEELGFNTDVQYPVTVNLPEAIKQKGDLKLSDFVESISYIPLKLTNDYYLKFFSLHGYDEQEKTFFVGDYCCVLAADSTGVLKNAIGRIGQGPGEYPQVGTVSLDTKNKLVYIKAGMSNIMQKYDYNGRFIRNLFRVAHEDAFTSAVYYHQDNFVTIGESYFTPLYPSFHKLYGFGVMDTTGVLLDKSPPQAAQISLNESERIAQFANFAGPTFYNDRVLLVNCGIADTVFTVENKKVIPRYYLDYGDEKPKLKDFWIASKERQTAIRNNIFIMNPCYETNRYFLIKLTRKGEEYIICHDKYRNFTCAIPYNYDGFSDEWKEENESGGSGGIPINNFGFTNDIDGGIDAYPVLASSEGNYWVSYVDADLMKSILTDSYFEKRNNVANKAQQEELKKLVASLNEEDNPVLILMKLKEDAK